jgi:AMP-polyphosphate phosphotransferase
MRKGRARTKQTYAKRVRTLHHELLQANASLKHAGFKVLVILAGPEGAGRGDLLHTLAGWLDPRGLETFSYHPPTEDEKSRPHQWRFWQSLPAIGRIGLYAGSWYTETLREHARGANERDDLAREAERIREFEHLLVDNGTLVLKIWLHLSKKDQGRRLRALEKDRNTAWRVTDEEWHHHRIYDRLAKTAAFIRSRTNVRGAPWITIDAADERARDLAVGELLLQRITAHQRKRQRLAPPKPARPVPLRPRGLRKLAAVDSPVRSPTRNTKRSANAGSGA